MLENLTYKFKNRNSKKNLLNKLKELEKEHNELRKDTVGSQGWGYYTITLGGSSKKQKERRDESLQGQINDILDYLGIDWSDSKLGPKPKEEKK